MIGIVVTGHGLFAEGIQSSAVMIAGVNENARYVCFKEGMGTEELAADLNAAFAAPRPLAQRAPQAPHQPGSDFPDTRLAHTGAEAGFRRPVV